MKTTFEETAPDLFQSITEWKQYQNLLEPLLNEKNKIKLRLLLDTFLLSVYHPVDNPVVEKAVQLMCDPEKHCELKEVQKIISVSRKTLFRLFKKHTGVSPTAFRRIARFRKALALQKKNDENLTQLAYEAHFSDQAHFTNDIKKITGGGPKKLFKEMVYISDSPFLIKLNK